MVSKNIEGIELVLQDQILKWLNRTLISDRIMQTVRKTMIPENWKNALNGCASRPFWAAIRHNHKSFDLKMSHCIRKPTICICESKGAVSCAVTAQLNSAFVFATQIVQSLFFLNPKFQALSHLMWLHSLICIRPVRKPNCWIPNAKAHLLAHLFRGHLLGY